jgi:hypothetical protein
MHSLLLFPSPQLSSSLLPQSATYWEVALEDVQVQGLSLTNVDAAIIDSGKEQG